MNTPLSKLFKVDNPGQHAHIDTQFPEWLNTVPDFGAHERGENCLCITPIGKDNTCYWGALDIDAKKGTPAINHKKLQKFIDSHKLPLNLFVSKSGRGAHAYLFGKTPVDADSMISSLKLYATLIRPQISEKNEIEIFPKQSELVGDDNGSCIRIPCFGDSTQPCFEGEPKIVPLLTVPPCIAQTPVPGERNDFMYHLSNFLYLSRVKNVMGMVRIINGTLHDSLPDKEITMVCNSAKRMRNHRNSTGKGWGLGCASCPQSRKERCKFSVQQMANQMAALITIEVLFFIAGDSTVRITFEEQQLVFEVEEAKMYDRVKTKFALEKALDFLPMQQKEWKTYIINAIIEADRVPGLSSYDKGHEIIRFLKKNSPKFNTGTASIYEGMPTFINHMEVLIIPDDVYNFINRTKEITATLEEVIKTIEHLGKYEVIDGTPFYRVPSRKICKRGFIPEFAIPVVAHIDEKDVSVEAGVDGKGNPVAVYMNNFGEQIEPTSAWLRDHPNTRKKVIKITNEIAKAPKISF